MKIKIFQIDKDRDTNNVMFLAYERLERFQGSKEIDSNIYDMVYEKDMDCKNLEDVYAKFNIDHPQDYRARSLSVSDIVQVCESNEIKPGFYFCDSVGFKEVEFEPNQCQVKYMEEEEMDKIFVLYVQVGKYPEVVEIENTLEAKQNLVGGDIEQFCPYDDECAIIVNEYGKIEGLPLNRAVYFDPDKKDRMMDIMAGDFFVCGAPYESSEFESLSPEMTEKYMNMFKYPERFYRWQRDIVVEPYMPKINNLEEKMKKAEQTAKDNINTKDIANQSKDDYTK